MLWHLAGRDQHGVEAHVADRGIGIGRVPGFRRGDDALALPFGHGLGVREAAVCRELTKLHEEIRRGTLATLARDYAAGAEIRGEIVIVVAPPTAAAERAAADDVDDLLRRALGRVSVKDAVGEVAAATGRPRREIYQRALALTKASNDSATE